MVEERVITAAGLTFVGLSAITPISVLSASNSSRFSYRNFIRDPDSEAAAREAMRVFVLQSGVTSAVLGVMAYAATQKVEWALATLGAGLASTALLYLDMMDVIDEVAAKHCGRSSGSGPGSWGGSLPRSTD